VIDLGCGLSVKIDGDDDRQVWLCFDTVISAQKVAINMDAYAETGQSASIARKAIKQWCDEMRMFVFKK
jgi:post-segregation antitoxin (ccd killing protein)